MPTRLGYGRNVRWGWNRVSGNADKGGFGLALMKLITKSGSTKENLFEIECMSMLL